MRSTTPLLRVGVLAIVMVALAAYVFKSPPSADGHYDFDAFYCAAEAMATGSDPYRFEPLHSCETRSLQLPATVVVPAPLPPYAVAVFVPLSKLPFPQANLLWLATLVAAGFTITWAIVALTGLPFWLVSMCVATSLLLEPLTNGAMAPVPIAFICASAVSIVRSRWFLAAALLGFACIQPHVAFPPILAVVVLIPAMRTRLLGVGVLVGVLSLAVGGAGLNIEYLTAVLPAHAASELASFNQYSLSALLHAAGVPDRVAIGLGSAQYAVFALLGVLVAQALQRKLPGSVVLAPLALAVTGGTFIHQQEVAGALPLAFLLAADAGCTLAWAAVGLLAVPWQYLLDYGYSLAAALVVSGVLLYRRSVGPAGAVAVGLLVGSALWVTHMLLPLHPTAATLPAVSSGSLAEAGWVAMQSRFPPGGLAWAVGHVLTYTGLALVYVGVVKLIRLSRREPVRVQ